MTGGHAWRVVTLTGEPSLDLGYKVFGNPTRGIRAKMVLPDGDTGFIKVICANTA